MSLARQLFHDVRPLFRILEEPFGRPAAYYGFTNRSILDESFIQSSRPSIDVSERDDIYIVEADLPGVKKEDVEVMVGDSGHRVTIEGKILSRRGGHGAAAGVSEESTTAEPPADSQSTSQVPDSGSDSMSNTEKVTTPIIAERPTSVGATRSSSSFTRTVWLPHAVDGKAVTAKLLDGVLTLTIPKADDKASVKVAVE